MLASIMEESWGDMFDAAEAEGVETDGDWEIVGVAEEVAEAPRPPRQPRWCKDGNNCKWANCLFRHEPCVHKERGWCRNGWACPYDHRDKRRLLSCVPVALSDEGQMWDMFMQLGLDAHSSSCIALAGMDRTGRKMLCESLEIAKEQGRLTRLDVSDDGKDVVCEWVTAAEPAPVYDADEKAAALKSLTYWEHQVVESIWRKMERADELLVMQAEEVATKEAVAAAEKVAAAKAHDEEVAKKFARWRLMPASVKKDCGCHECFDCLDTSDHYAEYTQEDYEADLAAERKADRVTWRRKED